VNPTSNALKLYIPNQQLESLEAPYANSKTAEKWIADLPLAHIGETSRQVYRALTELNRYNMPVNQRFKILEMFHKPVEYLNRSLTKHYLGQPFPLSQKHYRISELLRELYWEMAIGYKIILNANLSGFAQSLDNKIFIASITRAVEFLSHILFKCYEVYNEPNKNIWLELHHLYLFAEHNKIENTKIRQGGDGKSSFSIEQLYKRILLLTVANPYRLPQKEIQRVYDALTEWVDDVSLLPVNAISNPSGLFVVDLDVDKPPVYLHHNKDEANNGQLRIIDTSALARRIRDLTSDLEGDSATVADLLPETTKRLVLAWGAVPKRNFTRTGKNLPVNVTLGLSATHYFIDKTQVERETVSYNTRAQFEESKLVGQNTVDNTSMPDVWDIADNPSLQVPDQFDVPTFFDTAYKTEVQEFEDPEQDLYESHRCMLVNESAGGYCIRWRQNMPLKTMVGSLIGMRQLDNEDKIWNIGVIRWIRNRNDDIFLGVEILAPKAEAIAARNISAKAKVTNYTRSLMLPEARVVNQPRTLITPSLYHVGDKLKLDIHGQKVKVLLTKLLESTSTFSQFQFNILETAEKSSVTDKNDRIKNFDQIWSSI